MAHTYVSNLVHCIFSTKQRERFIDAELRERLWPFMGGLARQQKAHALAIGGIEDHVHLLLSVPAVEPLAHLLQKVKGASSKWVHETFPRQRNFAWQEGYGAFSISFSHEQATIEYIEQQAEHHRRRTFKEEFLAILNKHHIEYDPRYVWD